MTSAHVVKTSVTNNVTVLFRTTLSRTIKQYELLILLGSNHLHCLIINHFLLNKLNTRIEHFIRDFIKFSNRSKTKEPPKFLSSSSIRGSSVASFLWKPAHFEFQAPFIWPRVPEAILPPSYLRRGNVYLVSFKSSTNRFTLRTRTRLEERDNSGGRVVSPRQVG